MKNTVKVIFTAVSESYRFRVKTLNLGGVYPKIDIAVIDEENGLHEFSVVKVVTSYSSEIVSASIVQAIRQIDYFWNILSYLGNSVIKPTGKVYYEVKGVRNEFNSNSGSVFFGAILIASVGPEWFESQKEQFSRNYNMDLLKRFNFSMSIEEPIGRFISLYSLLGTLVGDKQGTIDAAIERADPSVEKNYGFNGAIETIYTRLRNELAHVREGVSIIETLKHIKVHLPSFEHLVKQVLERFILKN